MQLTNRSKSSSSIKFTNPQHRFVGVEDITI
nr:MAG TPA: hypothetical protein [Caudoviricetes sp.]